MYLQIKNREVFEKLRLTRGLEDWDLDKESRQASTSDQLLQAEDLKIEKLPKRQRWQDFSSFSPPSFVQDQDEGRIFTASLMDSLEEKRNNKFITRFINHASFTQRSLNIKDRNPGFRVTQAGNIEPSPWLLVNPNLVCPIVK